MTARMSALAAVAWAAIAASAHGQDRVEVSCLPERIMAQPGETIELTAFVASAAGAITRNVAVSWAVSAGRVVDAQSLATRWQLAEAARDTRHVATATVTVNGTPAGTCSLGVWVAPVPPPGQVRGEYVTRRSYLRPGQAAEAGFGLYSYFLLREPATVAERARAEAFIGAFQDALAGVGDQEDYVERRRLNGSYLPVTGELPSRQTRDERRTWTLEHYDYAQAQRLLSLYPALTGRGPFIIAVPSPLRAPVKPMLPWDMTDVDSAAIGQAVNRFTNQAAQLYDWQDHVTLQMLRDRVLTTVAGMFVGRAAAERWLQIVR